MRKLPGAGFVGLIALLAITTIVPLSAAAEESDGNAWKNTAELGVVATSGNTESTTFGFKDTLTREGAKSTLSFKLAGLRVESATGDRWVLDTGGDLIVNDPDKELTAENYALSGKYARTITERMEWFVGAGWDRNQFTGIDNRYIVGGGMSTVWHDNDKIKFRTDYAFTYTSQEDVVAAPGIDRRNSSAGLRLAWDYHHTFGQNTEYINALVVDQNLDETDDLRADMINSLSLKMTDRLAIKLSLQFLYDNMPSLEMVQVFSDPDDFPADPSGTILIELDELDTVFTTALVIDF